MSAHLFDLFAAPPCRSASSFFRPRRSQFPFHFALDEQRGKRADAIRDELKTKGWVIEDTAKGPKLKKI